MCRLEPCEEATFGGPMDASVGAVVYAHWSVVDKLHYAGRCTEAIEKLLLPKIQEASRFLSSVANLASSRGWR